MPSFRNELNQWLCEINDLESEINFSNAFDKQCTLFEKLDSISIFQHMEKFISTVLGKKIAREIILNECGMDPNDVKIFLFILISCDKSSKITFKL